MQKTSLIAAAALLAGAGLIVSHAPAAGLGAVHVLKGGTFEASGATPAPGGKGILFVDDSRPDVVLRLDLAEDGSPAGPAQPVPMGVNVTDPEGITTDGTYVYVVGSQSRGKPDGAGLVRFRLEGGHGAEAVQDLESILSKQVPPLRDSKRGRGSLNIEGLAWDAKQRRLLLGLRAPLEGGRALLVPLTLRDRGGALDASNLEVGAPIALDLGGSGIRGMEADGAGGFWVIAGGVEGAGTFRLARWDGAGSTVKFTATFPTELKPEGVARTKVGGKERTLVLCDTSRYLLVD
jgi:hypothetical protein